jgi:hypothetical protein
MWQCTKCRESIEGSFDVCWNCGTSKQGVEDPSFRKAEDAEVAPGAAAVAVRPSTLPHTSPTEHAIQPGERSARVPPAVESRCPHCGGAELIRAVSLGLTAETGNVGLKYRALLVFGGTEPVYADVCKGCGSLTRLYVRETERNWIVD